MKNENIALAGGLTEGTKLYRYVTLAQFVSFLETGLTPFTRVTAWREREGGDPCEVPVMSMPCMRRGPLPDLLSKLFAQCWSLCAESDALWRIYSPHKDGLMMQTSVSRLREIRGIRRGLMAPVVYYDDLYEGLSCLAAEYVPPYDVAFLKRQAFQHEHEVRLVSVGDKDHMWMDCCFETAPVAASPDELLDKVILDPRVDDWYVHAIQHYCKRAHLSCIPAKSLLYSRNADASVGNSDTGESVHC